jgi:hypothetical protein
VTMEETATATNDQCSICTKHGDWPVFPSQVWLPGETVSRTTIEALCPACYYQLGAPFPETCTDEELRELDDEVVRLYRAHLLNSDFRPVVYTTWARPKLARDWICWSACQLCFAEVSRRPPWPFFWRDFGPHPECLERGVWIEPAIVCPHCAAILAQKHA